MKNWEEKLEKWFETKESTNMFMERHTKSDFDEMKNYIKTFIKEIIQEDNLCNVHITTQK